MAVTLVAKPHAAGLLGRFAPNVELRPFVAPWTAFNGKYRLHRWPWPQLQRLRRELRAEAFDLGASARPDPRDHALLFAGGVQRRLGFPRTGSRLLLTDPLTVPPDRHRSAHWRRVASRLGLEIAPVPIAAPANKPQRIAMHVTAGHRVREWPRDRFDALAQKLRSEGWDVVLIDDSVKNVDQLLTILSSVDRFIGNDSGPGHVAALLGIPTFTIFGPQLPELFAPQHPRAAWIEGAPCPFKPCFDRCRFVEPHCLLGVSVEGASAAITDWLRRANSDVDIGSR